MPKKSSSKPLKPQDPVAVPEKNPSPAPKKPSKEIDEIFAAKKRKKPEQNQDNPVKAEGSKLDKRTGDGFTVYSQEELGIGRLMLEVQDCVLLIVLAVSDCKMKILGALYGFEMSKITALQGPLEAIGSKTWHE
ncbi:hypothetical protein C3L33_21756, partial [Rhododendron williamsianum]